MSPLVSIIIPCLNAGPWLAEALASCLSQTHRRVEVVFVDNGSRDNSVKVAKGFKDSRLLIIKCERKGASAARNVGLMHAQGEFVQYLDADDVLERDKIRAQLAQLSSAPEGALASAGWARFRSDIAEANFSKESVWRDSSPEEFLICSWLGGGMMPVFAWLTPRAVIDKAGTWNESLTTNDDGEFFTRAVLHSSGVVFCEGARGYYRSAAVPSLSKARDPEALLSAFHATELSCQSLLQASKHPSANMACATLYQRYACDTFPAAPDLVAKAEERVRALGGSELRPAGGCAFRVCSALFGWKLAARIRSSVADYRKRRAPVG